MYLLVVVSYLIVTVFYMLSSIDCKLWPFEYTFSDVSLSFDFQSLFNTVWNKFSDLLEEEFHSCRGELGMLCGLPVALCQNEVDSENISSCLLRCHAKHYLKNNCPADFIVQYCS